MFWFFTSVTCVPFELPIEDDPDVVVLLLFCVELLLLLLLFDDNDPLELWCIPLDDEFCCIGSSSHFDDVEFDSKSSHLGWDCRSDCDGARVVRSSFVETPIWFDRLESRHPECGGGATRPMLRGNPNSSGLKSDACVRGLKNPEAVDGEGHSSDPPPYTLRGLWVIMLPVLAPQSAGGPTLSRKILN